jgi:predicted anti-sigma-YlaC factor YlaD
MSCDEIREQLVDLVYDEGGVLPAGSEVKEHLRICPACREEVEELKRTRNYLHLWKDEPPLRSISIARQERVINKNASLRYLRYAAVAAMVLISLLALANTQVSWNKNGFTFSTHFFAQHNTEQDYYTKAEMRDLMKETLNYTNETNYLMIQKVLDTVEQDRWRDIHLIRDQVAKNQNRN